MAVAAAVLLGAPIAQAQVDSYTLTASQGTFTPVTGGTPVDAIETDDEISGTIPLGFSFVFDGTTYSQVKASSNGWLTFNTATTTNNRFNELNVGPTSIRPLVAPLWDDLDGDGGAASYTTTGTAPNRVFTMEWLNYYWVYTATAPGISFQVKLYEGTNRVEFIYRQESGALSSPTASIGLAGSTVGSFLSLNNASAAPTTSSTTETSNISTKPATGQIYAFTAPVLTGCSTPRGLTATNLSLTSATLNWTAASGNGTFTVEYGPTGFVPGTNAPGSVLRTGVTGNSLNITGLTAFNRYQFYVTQNCGGTLGNSARSNPGAFTALNDDCVGAIPLTVSTGNICTTRTRFTLTGASSSAGAPAPSCASFDGGDVWFSVVVPANGALTFETDSVGGSGITDTGMEIYSGTCGNLTSIQCDDDSSPNGNYSFIDRTGLTPGSTIYVRVWEYNESAPTGRVAICVRSISPPPLPTNDECATAITVQSDPVCSSPTNGYVTGATQSQAAGCGSVAQANDVWYKFTAVSTAQAITLTPQFSAVMDVLRGACGSLTSFSCATVSSGNGTARILTGLTVGQSYYIRVFANTANVPVSQAIFSLCIKPAPGSCATPTGPTAANVTSSQATLNWAGILGTGESFTVLYGPRGFTTGTTVAGITATTTTLTGLTPDTDYCFFVSKNCGAQLGVSTPTAETCFRTLLSVPLNDEPCSAVSLNVTGSGQIAPAVNGTNVGSTTSLGGGLAALLPACSPSQQPKDVWYRLTMPAGQTSLSVGLSGNAAGMVRLFTAASCSTSFAQVACRSGNAANTGAGPQTFTGLTAGSTYYIAVSGYGSNDTAGPFVIGTVLAARNPLLGGELTVFPNPAHGGTLTLRLSGAGAAQAAQAQLINALGQVVRKQAVSIRNGGAEQPLSIDGLSRGLYTLRVEIGGGAVTRTVVID
ncbi:hypothetical protein GCM10027048_13440 [Hymenobacter coalescens]